MAEAELTTVARPYARAAFSQALDEASGLQTWSRMLTMMAATVQDSTVNAALENPTLTREQEANVLVELLGEEVNESGRNFITILSDYGRVSLLPQVSLMFELLKANHEKTMDVEITSAFDVSEAEEAKLSEALKRMLQCDVAVTSSVDEKLLGGAVVRAGDTVIDASVRGKLEKLTQTLG